MERAQKSASELAKLVEGLMGNGAKVTIRQDARDGWQAVVFSSPGIGRQYQDAASRIATTLSPHFDLMAADIPDSGWREQRD